jgi:tRNA(Ile)-lysidine synthase
MEEKSLTARIRLTVDGHRMMPAADATLAGVATPAAADAAADVAAVATPAAVAGAAAPPVVLMVSGGSDSVALARLLPPLYPRCCYTILHVNHQLRGEDADGDERFVVALAEELGLPCEVRRIDVAALAAARPNGNVEDVGRHARYQAAAETLDELCRQAGLAPAQGRVATAHTRDDRVETLFMRLVVGGGGSGLSSIPFVNGRTIRPLLDCTRAELREALLRDAPPPSPPQPDAPPPQPDALPPRAPPQPDAPPPLAAPQPDAQPLAPSLAAPPWREDASNRDTRRLRAFVRHEVIPLLETRNPGLLATVARSLDVLADEDAYLQKCAERLLNPSSTPASDELHLDTALFDGDPVLVRRAVREACRRVMPANARLTFGHIDNIAENGRHIGFATDIPGDVTVRNVYGTLIIRRKTAAEKPRHDPRYVDGREDSAV